MSREQTEADLKLMKAANINAVRTSHYPNNSSSTSCATSTACT